MDTNPYKSPTFTPLDKNWRVRRGGAESTLLKTGLLHRRVMIHRPVEATIEYFARGIRDRILLDGEAVVSRLPLIWLHSRFDFTIPTRDGDLPASVSLKLKRGLRMAKFEIEIDGIVAYMEKDEG